MSKASGINLDDLVEKTPVLNATLWLLRKEKRSRRVPVNRDGSFRLELLELSGPERSVELVAGNFRIREVLDPTQEFIELTVPIHKIGRAGSLSVEVTAAEDDTLALCR